MTPRLFLGVVGLESKRLMSYRADFWLSMLGGLAASVGVPYLLWRSVWLARPPADGTIGGFSFPELITYYVAVGLLTSVVRGLTIPYSTADEIYEGTLSRFLLFPTRYLPFKYAQHLGQLAPTLLQVSVLAVLFAGIFGLPADAGISPGSIVASLAAALVANLLYFLLAFSLLLVAFWADHVWALVVMLQIVSGLLGGALLPLDLFPAAARAVIELTPFPCLYAWPVEALLGRLDATAWLAHLAVAVVWCGLLIGASRVLWARGRLRYTGVGI